MCILQSCHSEVVFLIILQQVNGYSKDIEQCAAKCVDGHLGLLPTVLKKMKSSSTRQIPAQLRWPEDSKSWLFPLWNKNTGILLWGRCGPSYLYSHLYCKSTHHIIKWIISQLAGMLKISTVMKHVPHFPKKPEYLYRRPGVPALCLGSILLMWVKVIPTTVRNRKASECGFDKVHVIPQTNLMAWVFFMSCLVDVSVKQGRCFHVELGILMDYIQMV